MRSSPDDMTYPLYIKEKAQQLRREKKMTIDEIAECLAISRTTIYHWVRDIPIPRTANETAAQRRRAQQNKERYERLREAAYEEGLMFFEALERQMGFRDFVILFITEGYKRSRNTVAIGNSDPSVVRLSAYWLERLSRNQLTYSVQYHADQNLDALTRFWGDLLEVDPGAIRLQRKSNSNGLAGRNWRSEHGVLTVCANDTYLRAELQAWMDVLQSEWEDLVEG
jgi:transcriptional regulator with XRE-family HTH domain